MTNQLAIDAHNKYSAHELTRCFSVRPNMSTINKLPMLPNISSVGIPKRPNSSRILLNVTTDMMTME